MCGYFCTLVARNDCEKNDKMILKYFHKLIICGKYRKFEKSENAFTMNAQKYHIT